MQIRKAVVLYTSDIHGHARPFQEGKSSPKVGGLAYLASAVDEVRRQHPDEPVFWVDAGDTLPNTTLSDLTRGQPLIDTMAAHGLDAMAVGNHEFDSTWGRKALAEVASRSPFPLLAANIRQADGSLLPGLGDVTNLEHQGISASVLGLTTPETPQTTLPSNVAGLTFQPLDQALRDNAGKLVGDLRILAVHDGPEALRPVAEGTDQAYLIVGGHTADCVPEPIRMGHSLYVKTDDYGRKLGVLELEFDADSHRIVGYHNELVPVGPDHQQPDAATETVLAAAEVDLQALLGRTVGSSQVDLLRNHKGESPLDNLIADAMRAASGADVAVRNSTATRADLNAGDVTLGDLYAIVPWDEPIQSVTLTTRDFAAVLEHSVSTTADPHVLQVSGLRVDYDLSRPEGQRLREARLDDGRALVHEGQPVDPDRTLRVAARPFLVQGGLGYDSFKKGTDPQKGPILRQALEEHISSRSPLQSPSLGRLKFQTVEGS